MLVIKLLQSPCFSDKMLSIFSLCFLDVHSISLKAVCRLIPLWSIIGS